LSVHEEARGQGLPDVNPAKRETLLAPSPDERVGRFTLRQLGILQWVGTLAPPLTWFSQHLVGYGVGQAVCRSGGMNWGVDYDLWQMLMTAVGGLLCVVGFAAALAVFLHTKGADWGDGPPEEGRWQGQSPYGRLYFFACAALVANVLFLTIILLDGTASIVDVICRQS
jgi:hypothetical protein